MAVNFPNNPAIGLTWLDPSNQVSYTWDGIKWLSTGTGVSFTTVILSIDNDDSALVGGDATTAINAALITNGDIFATGDLRPGNTVLINDSGNADANVNVTIGQYLYDGNIWLQVPTTGVQVVSVFGRVGTVTADEGDYNIGQMGDVSLSPTPTSTTNSLLRFNGTNWVPGEARNTVSVTLPLAKTGGDVTPSLTFTIDTLNTLP